MGIVVQQYAIRYCYNCITIQTHNLVLLCKCGHSQPSTKTISITTKCLTPAWTWFYRSPWKQVSTLRQPIEKSSQLFPHLSSWIKNRPVFSSNPFSVADGCLFWDRYSVLTCDRDKSADTGQCVPSSTPWWDKDGYKLKCIWICLDIMVFELLLGRRL